MTQPTYAITGILLKPGQESPPPRKEVTSWLNSPANARQVSLFMRALTEFQHLSPTQDALSYYRIAGIHGNPDVEWDGVGNPPGTVGRPSWWCAHNKETFVSWHRPFLVLFEQRIHEIMQGIIDKNIPADRQGPWRDAARDWRQPYWDWGLKQPYIDGLGIPEIFTKDRLDIMDLADNSPPTTENIANPLAKFANPTGFAMGDASMGKFALTEDPWSKAIATSRCGINRADTATSWANGVNNWEKANQAMAAGNQAGSIPDQIYRLFATNLSSWESFASTRSQPPPMPSDFMSLEAIHNAIHGYVGGRDTLVGHMGDPSVAAFDPIFWFHHCNVDHLAATFQTLHPDMWYDPVTEFAATKLDPFHRDTASTSWTADDTRDWKANFRYTYDDLEELRPRQSLATFHGFVARALRRSHAHAGGESGGGLATLRKRINDKYGAVCREIRDATGIQGKGNDYVINITYDRYALQGTPYHIHFFLGTPPPAEADSFSYAEETYIGNVYTFSSNLEPDANGSQCHNCVEQKSEGVLSTAQIPLTSAILDAAKYPDKTGLRSMLPEEVESYLASYLSWRVTTAAGESNESPPQTTIVDMSRLPKTKISIMKGHVHYPDNDAELTTYEDYTPLWGATLGKPGGAVLPDA